MSLRPRIRQVFIRIAVLVIAGAAVFGTLRWLRPDLNLTLTRDELQNLVDSKFPIEQELLGEKVTFNRPQVELHEGSDRIGVRMDVRLKSWGPRIAWGHLEGDWKLRYDPNQGAVFFDSFAIQALDINGLDPRIHETVTEVAQALLRAYLDEAPVLRLNDHDLRQAFAHGAVKSLQVRGGKVEIVLGR